MPFVPDTYHIGQYENACKSWKGPPPLRLILTSVLIFSPKVDISQKSMLGFSSTSFSSEPSPQNVCSMIFECWQPLPILLGNCFHRRCVHNRSATFLATFHKNTSFTLVSSDKSSLHYPPPSTTHPPQKYGSSVFHSAQRHQNPKRWRLLFHCN